MLIWVVWFIYDFKLAFLADAEWLLLRLRTKYRLTCDISLCNNTCSVQKPCRSTAISIHITFLLTLLRILRIFREPLI